MTASDATVTYLELRESTSEGDPAAGLSHSSSGLVLLHVQELAASGEPRGAVTVLHDAGEHGGRLLDFGRALASAGWAVALPDLRGHGRSEGPRGHSNGIKEVLRDLSDVQDHLAYRQPEAAKVLVGQGLGAIWALAFACERPGEVAALVLLSPLLEPRFELPKDSGGLMKLFKKPGPTTPGKIGWSASALTRDAAAQSARASDALVHDVITLRAGGEARDAAAKYAAKLGGLSIPVLVVHGSEDPLTPLASVKGLRGPKLTLEVIEGGLHDLLHDRSASDVASRTCAWLAGALKTI